MPKKDVQRSPSSTSRESFSAAIIADMVAEFPDHVEHIHHDRHSIRSGDIRRNSSTKSKGKTVSRNNSTKKTQDGDSISNGKAVINTNQNDQDNMAYVSDHESKPNGKVTICRTSSVKDSSSQDGDAAFINVEDVSTKANGTDISKGVILNAQFDHKLGSDFLKDQKAIELTNSHSVQINDGGSKETSKAPKDVAAKTFAEMSMSRKIAFVFSFLPSIMFVLCFAVILPCEKRMPCIQHLWTTTLKNTELTSVLKVPENIVFTYVQNGTNKLKFLRLSDGGLEREHELLSKPPRYMECAKLTSSDRQSCVVMKEEDDKTIQRIKFDFFNATTGKIIPRNDSRGQDEFPQGSAVVLPACDGDGVSEVAVAVSATQIEIVSIRVFVPIEGCDGVPTRLMSWPTKNETYLLFTCTNGTNEHLRGISQDKYCPVNGTVNRTGNGEILTLETREKGSFSESLILPTEDGLVLWIGDEVTLLEPNGTKRWTVSSQGHADKNRFLQYGRFNKNGPQIALLSSNIASSFQVSTITPETGSLAWNRTIANAEVSDISLVNGQEKDFLLVVMRKIVKGLTNQATTHINEVSTSIANFLAQEELEAKLSNMTDLTVSEEISFMELDGSYSHTVQERKMSYSESKTYNSRVTVVPLKSREDKELTVLISKQPTMDALVPVTEIKAISVANWDISLPNNRQCLWE